MVTKTRSSRRMVYLLIIPLLFLAFFLAFKSLFLLNQLTSPSVDFPSLQVKNNPRWFQILRDYPLEKRIRVGFLNIPKHEREWYNYKASGPLIIENIHISLEPIPLNVTWETLYPEWINDEASYCPEIPLPNVDVDVIVAKVPCNGWSENKGLRDVFRLQVNLAAANLAVQSGLGRVDRIVYVVFIGSCGPMHEIFKCDERLRHVDDYWVYKPHLPRLKQKLLMPVGSCHVALPYAQLGQEVWRPENVDNLTSEATRKQQVAYVTVIHSSKAYVSGAIALAQSIRQSGSKKDMILLHDQSLTKKSILGLSLAGWKLHFINKIRSPFSKKHFYNEWNSKLLVWQVTGYDKLVFIDANFIILKKIDYLFYYPQLSASCNDRGLFISGIMVVEPSPCMFKYLVEKSSKVESYNGGDQGFLNEIFVWWHRLSKRMNTMNYFDEKFNGTLTLPEIDLEGVHYLGLKPCLCYRDYDCNWDIGGRNVFASDFAQEKWWKIYDKMSEKLKGYCGLNKEVEKRIEKWRRISEKSSLPDRHWDIQVKDPRKKKVLIH